MYLCMYIDTTVYTNVHVHGEEFCTVIVHVLTLQRHILSVVSSHEGALHGMALMLRPRLIVRLPAVQVDMAGKAGHTISLVDARAREVSVVSQVEETSCCHG